MFDEELFPETDACPHVQDPPDQYPTSTRELGTGRQHASPLSHRPSSEASCHGLPTVRSHPPTALIAACGLLDGRARTGLDLIDRINPFASLAILSKSMTRTLEAGGGRDLVQASEPHTGGRERACGPRRPVQDRARTGARALPQMPGRRMARGPPPSCGSRKRAL